MKSFKNVFTKEMFDVDDGNLFSRHNLVIKASLREIREKCEYFHFREIFSDYLENLIVEWTNPDLIKEIWDDFMESYGYLLTENKSVNKIHYKLSLAFDDIEYDRILKSEYLNYSNKLQKKRFYKSFLIQAVDLSEVSIELLISFFKYSISWNNDDIIKNYVLYGIDGVYCENPIVKEFISVVKLIKCINYLKENKRVVKVDSKKVNNQLSINQSLILIDKFRSIESDVWDNIDKTKKARLISKLINKNYDNIKKGLTLLDKKGSETTNRFKKDVELIDGLINEAFL